MSEMSNKRNLRAVTYMCPAHPIQLYELIIEMLEKTLNCFATLQYESRSSGPLPDRPDPFTSDSIDLAFMTPTSYIKFKETNNPYGELLPVSPVFRHPKNVNNTPGYYADIIVHCDKKAHNVNNMMDLRGSVFAYSDEESLSGCKIILKELHKKGENAAFFGTTLQSGSHMASAQMVLTKQAEWASLDSTTLLYSKKYMQDGGQDILVLDSFGPLLPFPIVVNSRLPAELKKAIANAFISSIQGGKWTKQFLKYGVLKYTSIDESMYTNYSQDYANTKSKKLSIPYY